MTLLPKTAWSSKEYSLEVIIQIEKKIASELREQKPKETVVEPIVNLIRELNVDMRPLHSTVDDETLRSYFVISEVDRNASSEIVAKLRECQGIEAAYVKPDSIDPSQ